MLCCLQEERPKLFLIIIPTTVTTVAEKFRAKSCDCSTFVIALHSHSSAVDRFHVLRVIGEKAEDEQGELTRPGGWQWDRVQAHQSPAPRPVAAL